jgi:RND superfamily putative drug exporter
MTTLTQTQAEAPTGAPAARPGPLGRLGRLAYRRRGWTLLAWLGAFAIAILASQFGGDFAADYSAPGSDSRAAQELLEERFPARSGATIDVVVEAGRGVSDPAVAADVNALLDQISAAPHVAAVDDPYQTPGAISPDGQTLLAQARLDVTNPVDMPVEETEELLALAEATERPGLSVALGGQTVGFAEQGEIGSEMIGLIAAAIILLLVFGSVVAAGLPIATALAALAVSSTLTGVVLLLVDAPDWSTSLATMLGIGIGIDYALLMVTRFREWRAAGLDPEAATSATLDTAGRAVLIAGSTVVVSMLGLFAMGLSFMRGAALVTILGILVVMVASVTLFPALLGYLGRRVDRLRLPLGRRATVMVSADGHIEPSRTWLWWSNLIARHRVVAGLAGVAMLLVLAAPFLGVRFGFPDTGNNQEDTSTRQAYDRLARGFGEGANGPLLVAVDLTGGGDPAVLEALAADLGQTPGVAAVTPPQVNPDGDTAVLTVVPTAGPQAAETEQLVRDLRDETIPAAVAGSGAEAHLGGVTATAIDSTDNVAQRIPLLIAGVVALSMVLLVVAFRSLLVAVQAAAMNLLSVAAAYGVVAYVLQGGWAGQLIGIDTETPLPAFVPVLMFAVLFGLSMDYEVFLVSRMREVWVRTRDHGRAITHGLAGTGRVITAAAAIMVAVFAAFVPSPDLVLKVIGVGMAAAILIDATIVRMLLVPAVMHLTGRATWWLPAWLGRTLPHLHIEGRPEAHLPPARELALAGDRG